MFFGSATRMSCSTSNDDWFIEIESPDEAEEVLPEWIDCYIIENIDPTICGPLSKDLSSILPLRCHATTSGKSSAETHTSSATQFPKTDHLKRTRRRAATESEINLRANLNGARIHQRQQSSSSSLTNEDVKSEDAITDTQPKGCNTKKRKQKEKCNKNTIPWSLDVLVGSVQQVNDSLNNATTTLNVTSPSLLSILAKYGLSDQSPNFIHQALPGRPAKNKKERDEWNKSAWPTLFFEKKTTQFKQEEKALALDEIELMKTGMQEALADAMMGNEQWREWREQIEATSDTKFTSSISGAVVVNPQTGSIVSRASQERKLQGTDSDAKKWLSFPDYINPLSTAPVLAIQGVSRIERQVAVSNGMESDEFRGGQYLCTGFDVYLTKEPNIFEAMSLVHSRVRRVIFGIPDEGMGGLGGTKTRGIHSLPGTNHHYRAFRLNLSDGSDGSSKETMTRKSLIAQLYTIHKEKGVEC